MAHAFFFRAGEGGRSAIEFYAFCFEFARRSAIWASRKAREGRKSLARSVAGFAALA